MYTVEILKKEYHNGKLKVVVNYTGGADSFTEELSLTDATQLNRVIRNRLNDLDNLKSFADALQTGVYTPTTDVAIPPTPAEIEKRDWFRNFNRLDALNRLNSLGALRPALVTELDTLKASVAADFKKAYIADM